MARVRVRARAMVVVDCSGARHETNHKMSERQEPSGAECQTFREGMMDGTNAGSRGRLPPLGLMRWADRFGRWRSKGSVKWGKQGCGVRGRVEAQPPLATAVTAKGPPRRGSANLTGSFPAFVLHCLALLGPAWSSAWTQPTERKRKLKNSPHETAAGKERKSWTRICHLTSHGCRRASEEADGAGCRFGCGGRTRCPSGDGDRVWDAQEAGTRRRAEQRAEGGWMHGRMWICVTRPFDTRAMHYWSLESMHARRVESSASLRRARARIGSGIAALPPAQPLCAAPAVFGASPVCECSHASQSQSSSLIDPSQSQKESGPKAGRRLGKRMEDGNLPGFIPSPERACFTSKAHAATHARMHPRGSTEAREGKGERSRCNTRRARAAQRPKEVALKASF